jgi:hypothetical protein
MRFGAADVIKNYELGSYHQAMEFFEIIVNKKKWDAMPKDLQAIWKYGVEAASQSNYWTAMKNYPKDLQTLINKNKVNVIRTPKSVFQAQLVAWDVLTKKLSDEDPFFKKVVDSQRAWAKDVCYYWFLNDADFKMGQPECRQGGAHRADPGGGRDDEWYDLARPDQLFRDVAIAPGRPRSVAGGGPDGHPPGRAVAGEPRQPA